MEGKINSDIKIPNEQNGNLKKPYIGKITETIGRGEDAKNSFVYITIKWAFISGCVITLLVVLNSWFFRENEKIPDFTEDIELVWDIIVPIITLALGYAFGKSRN